MKERREEAAVTRKAMLDKYRGTSFLTLPDRAKLRAEFLEVPKDQRTTWTKNWTGKGYAKHFPTYIGRAVDDFSRLVGRSNILGRRRTVKISPTSDDRSFQRAGIHISDTAGDKTIVHEMGHELEERDFSIHREALAFLDRRTRGERLKWLGDRYDKHEKTKRDQFLHEYRGKDYGRSATEIISMGLEYLYTKPLELARRDPDYFDFIYAVVRE